MAAILFRSHCIKGARNCLLPFGTKPLTGPKLPCHKWDLIMMEHTWMNLQRTYCKDLTYLWIQSYVFKISSIRDYCYWFSLYPRPTKLEGGGYTGFTLSVRPSVRPSVCRRHGFRSISQVSCGISISNFICILMVAIGRSLLIFSDVTFKIAAWRPYWIFWFPDSNFTLALNINFKLQRHNTYVYG